MGQEVVLCCPTRLGLNAMMQNLTLTLKPAVSRSNCKISDEGGMMDMTRQKIIQQVADRIHGMEITPDEARILNSNKGWHFEGLAHHLTDQELSQAIHIAKKLGS